MQYIKVTFLFKNTDFISEILLAELAELDFESFEEFPSTLLAYIKKDCFNEHKLHFFLNQAAIFKGVTFTAEELPDKNWNEVWEKSFDPIVVSEKCMIRAPFHNISQSKYLYEIVIEPKMSFGTGHHQTTSLMIEQMLSFNFKNKKVLDMGCGTGVLAFLAEKMGAIEIIAIDNDEWAYCNSLENKALNNSTQVNVKLGNATILIDNTFNTILANINKNILLNDMIYYANSLIPNGNLLISGFFKTDVTMLIDRAIKCGMFLQNASSKDEWACLLLKKEM